jgi:ribosomal protein L37AE/L43A
MDNQETIQVPACPDCGAITEVIRIVYGRPGPDLQKQAKEGLVHLGGCCPEDFRWFCKKCDKKFKDATNN